MRTYRRNLTILVAALTMTVGAATIGGCGTSAQAGGEAAAAKTFVVKGGPHTVRVSVDTSASTGDPTVHREYAAAAERGVEAALAEGGLLDLEAFFGRSLHPLKLLETPIATPAELGGAARAEQLLPVRDAAEGVLSEALGLVEPGPRLAAAVARMGGEGTDVAGALDAALEATRGEANPLLLFVTDGEDARFQGHYGESAAALAKRVTPLLPKAGPDTVIAMVGVGGSKRAASTPLTLKLVRAWEIACHHTGAQRCFVSAGFDLTHVLGTE